MLYSSFLFVGYFELYPLYCQALGNHEFDQGPEGLLPLLDGANFPILGANIQLDSKSVLNGKFSKSHVFDVGGEKIGVVGYTTRDTSSISMPGE